MTKHRWVLGIPVLALIFVGEHTRSEMAQFHEAPSSNGHDLRIRVVDDKNLGVRVMITLVDLRIYAPVELIAYTDWSGNATFRELPLGNYTVIVSSAGNELHRSQLAFKSAKGSTYEVVHLHNVTFADRTDKISLNDLNAPPEAYRQYLAGVKAIRAGDFEKALLALDKALMIYPGYSKSYNARGVAFHMIQNARQAEDSFRHAIEFDMDSLEPRINLGNLLLESNRPSEARIELQKAVEIDAENLTATELLLESMLVTHDESSAVSLARSLHRKGAKHPARFHLKIASALEEHGMVDLQAEEYSTLLQDEPSPSEKLQAEAFLSRLRNRENR